MRFLKIRGQWRRVVRNEAPNGATYLWFDPPPPIPVKVQSDLAIFASMFAGTP